MDELQGQLERVEAGQLLRKDENDAEIGQAQEALAVVVGAEGWVPVPALYAERARRVEDEQLSRLRLWYVVAMLRASRAVDQDRIDRHDADQAGRSMDALLRPHVSTQAVVHVALELKVTGVSR